MQVITAETQADFENCTIVPLEGSSILKYFIKDEGAVWKTNIKDFLSQNTIAKPDVVIITGGPFMQFGLSTWLKKKYGAKIILDYRDPFAINPGFHNNWFKVLIKSFFERKFNQDADALITVNRHCANLLNCFNSKKNAIVQNGYDETIKLKINPIRNKQKRTFIYPGKFYFSTSEMQSAFENTGAKLTYIGPDQGKLKLPSQNIQSKGFVSYEKAMITIAENDVGIIQTYGFKYVSTTKIFDFIRCCRIILIISDDKIGEGSIQDELKNYPNVFWSRNHMNDIADKIACIQNLDYVNPPENFSEKFSRSYQMQRLVQLINSL